MFYTQDGHSIHKTFASHFGIWTRVRDETVHRSVQSVPTATHVLRLPAAIQYLEWTVLAHRRLRSSQRKQPILNVN